MKMSDDEDFARATVLLMQHAARGRGCRWGEERCGRAAKIRAKEGLMDEGRRQGGELRERSRRIADDVQRLRYNGRDPDARHDLETIQRLALRYGARLLLDDGPSDYEALLALVESIDRPDPELARLVARVHAYPRLLVAVFNGKLRLEGA